MHLGKYYVASSNEPPSVPPRPTTPPSATVKSIHKSKSMSKNPFRTPLVTPNPTGASSSSQTRPTEPSPFDDPLPGFPEILDETVTDSKTSRPSIDGAFESRAAEASGSGSGSGWGSASTSYAPPAGPPPGMSQSFSTDPEARSTRMNSPNVSIPPSSMTTPVVIPSATGASNTSTTSYAPPPGPPSSTSQDLASPPILDATPPNEPPPPAYTPAANPYEGEATVEYGPRRPFQRAPPPLLVSQSFGPSGPPVQPNANGGAAGPGWTGYPGASHRNNASASSFLPPPPQHPSSNRPASTPPSSGTSPGLPPRRGRASDAAQQQRPLSDFAREFYAAGADVAVPEPAGPSSSSENPPDSLSSVHNPPPGPPPPRFAPPPGVPPPGPSSGSSSNRNDGRPTTIPTPGRPLQNKGRVLVYPAGHECRKCNNTGYKNYDPSHPCKKCWEKHGKPYTGALAYAPWDSAADRSTSTFQRPLPNFSPPQNASPRPPYSQSQSSFFSPPPGAAARLQRHGTSASVSHPPGPPLPPRGSNVGPSPVSPRPSLRYTWGAPPPGAAVVQPGDPRIGGRVCWRCGGDGWVSFMIFDTERCEVCNGIGRVF